MKRLSKLKFIQSRWFFSKPHPILRLLTIYINGDALIIIPLLIGISFCGFFSVRFMILMYGVFYAIRGLGEMMYWFFQQFSAKNYRPHDFGFKNLDNNAVYILYQLMAITSTSIGIGIILWVLLYLY